MLTVEGGDAEMTQQKNSRKGSAVWPMVLSWLSSLILALLAVFVMLFTTFGNVGYMQSCVKSSGYAQSAYDDMVQDFISYGAATGFDADVMTGFMSVDQVESDMQDAVAGLYAKTLTYYTRDNIAEAVYSAMEQATADRGITLEGETKTAVETVAEAVRMEYASYTAVPLVGQLRTLVQKLQKVMVIGLVVSAVLLCAAVVSMLHISRKDAHLGARCLAGQASPLGFGAAAEETARRGKKALQEAKDYFRPELMGRLDDVVLFDPLGPAQLAAIADRLLCELEERAARQGYTLRHTPAAAAALAGDTVPAYGARELRRKVSRAVEQALADRIASGTARPGVLFVADAAPDGHITLTMGDVAACAS